MLREIISNPSRYGSSMPAAALDSDEISAVLDYLKSNWGPDERLYQWERTFADEQQ